VIPGVDWGTASWTVDGETLTPESNGRVLLPMSISRDPQIAELTLTNTAGTRPLPATGGGGVSPLVPLGAVVLIALGGLLAARRPRRV
jgi:LPXTG-motif cell wall-anchored protein